MARKAPAGLYPQPTVITLGPFTGVSDAMEPAASRSDRLYRGTNTHIAPTGVVVGRPGFAAAGNSLDGVVQWIGQFSQTDGTEATVAICDGEIWTYNHGTETWTTVVDTADFTAASVSIDTSARIYCVTFADVLVVSDGVNKPFTWDGTAGDSGLTELTNCVALYGQPVVYYFKLFGIKASERDTIIWSEEGDPATGYEAGGYNNAWSLGGTKNEPIVALVPRNDSLGIVRPRSTTVIIGAVNDTFQTSGTRAAVSERIGTSSPGGVLVLDEGTVVIDSDARPQFWPNGQGYAEAPAMWEDCASTVASIPKSAVSNSQVIYDPLIDLVLIGIGSVATNNQTQYLAFERTGGVPNYVGLWNGFTTVAHGMVLDDDNQPRWMHADATGQIYVHGFPEDGPWSDDGTAIAHEVIGPAAGYDLDEECRFDEFTGVFFSKTNMTDVTVGYETPRGNGDSLLTFDITGGGFMLDVDVLGVGVLGGGAGEQRKRVGWRGFGRWCRPIVRLETVDQTMGLHLMRVTAFRQGRWPKVA